MCGAHAVAHVRTGVAAAGAVSRASKATASPEAASLTTTKVPAPTPLDMGCPTPRQSTAAKAASTAWPARVQRRDAHLRAPRVVRSRRAYAGLHLVRAHRTPPPTHRDGLRCAAAAPLSATARHYTSIGKERR